MSRFLCFSLVLMVYSVEMYAKNHSSLFSKQDTTNLMQPEICVISIDSISNSKATIYWNSLDTNAVKFVIYRKSEVQVNYDSIGYVPRNNTGYYKFIYSSPLNKYSHKIISVDSLGNKSLASNAVSSLNLNALEIEDDRVVRLSWNTIPKNVNDSVNIWRNNNEFGYKFVKKVAINDTTYLDTNNLVWQIQYILEFTSVDSCFLMDSGNVAPRFFSNSSTVHFASTNQSKFRTIKVYPNPVNDVLMFNTAEHLDNALISIYNTMGQKIAETIVINNDVDVSNIVPGVYVFTVEQGGTLYRGKFVK